MGMGDRSTIAKGGHGFKGNVQCLGKDSEKNVLAALKVRPTLASGAMPGSKSDGVGKNYRVECKSSINKTMPLDHSWLCKIASEARETDKTPLLTVSFVTTGGVSRTDGEWVMMLREDFLDITGGEL